MSDLLIVDGREEDRDMLQHSLESHGFQVSAVCDGVEALERAIASRPDLIISDVFLPGMSGFELCRQWHADEVLRSVPFIFHATGDRNPEDERPGMALGAQRFVHKPIQASALVDIIHQTLAEKDRQSVEVSRRTLLSVLEDQKRTADALRVSEQRMRAIVDSALDGIITIDHEGRIVEINPAAERMFELAPGSVFGQLLADHVIPPRLREKHTLGLARYLKNDGESSFLGRRIEMPGWRADGTEFPLELTVTRIPTDGSPMFTGHVRDITERQQAEENLRNSEARFRTIFKQAAVGVAQFNSVSGVVLQANRRYCEILGMPEELVVGETWMNLTFPDDLTDDVARMERMLAGEIREFTIRKRLQPRDRPLAWINLSVSATWQPGEEPSTHIAIVEDITEQMVASQKLVESEERHRRLVQNSPFCIHEIELDGTLSSVNPAGLTMIGLTHESQIRGSAYLSAVSEDDRPRIGELLEQACNGQTSEFEFESPDGQVFQSCFVPLTDGDGRIQRIMGITQDVTEKLRAEQELRESEARYRVMTEHATEAIVVLDVDTGRFVDFNQNACQLYKVSHEQLRQMGPADVSPTLQPGGEPSSTLAMQHIKQATEYDGQVHVFEWTHRNLQGGLIPCEVRLVTMPDQGKRLVRGAITDISDRKRGEAERESFIQQLEQKNAELERFTYTVSHDLKSPLITIKGFLGLLERDLQDDRAESVQEDMAEIASAADRMNRLLDDLLELSRVGRIANPVEGVPLQEVAQEAIDLLDAEITASGTRIEFDSELPVVTGDRVRLLEVFQNLLHNAVKFSADQPQPEVHLGTRQENGETVIYVQDNGIGIPPQYHERVFSLFEQLTPDGVGTGIGLSLVKRIVDVHGGWIRIESDGDGHGTTFCFTLGAGPNAE